MKTRSLIVGSDRAIFSGTRRCENMSCGLVLRESLLLKPSPQDTDERLRSAGMKTRNPVRGKRCCERGWNGDGLTTLGDQSLQKGWMGSRCVALLDNL